MSSSQETCLPESTEIDSEGSSCEERESRRRLLGDPESLPKKRRKQSTPVKFSTTLTAGECDESEDEPGAEAQAANNHDQHQEYEQPEGKPTTAPHSKSIQGQPSIKDENLNNEFRCQYCSQFFDNRIALELHLECEHNFTGIAQQQALSSSREESPSMQAQARISPETTGHLQTSEQSISPINLSGISIRNFAASAPWLAGQGQLQGQNEASLAKIAARNNNHFQPLPAGFPGTLAQFLPIPGFPMPDSTQLQRAAMGQFPKIFNPDAYCDLCNKEFCNKYFLKTHKANKHGIYVDPPAGQSQGNEGGSPSPFITPSSPISSLPGAITLKLGEPMQRIIEHNGMQQQQQQQLLVLPCDMCPKRFKNEDSLRKHKQKNHMNPNNETADPTQIQINLPSSTGDEDRQSPGGMEALFKQEYSIEQDDAVYPSTPRSIPMSPQSSQQGKETAFNGDRLRRLGVMNPEAFCELCCKEYCNKYFLRTHKLKRHGIFIPDNEKSPNSSAVAAAWHQVQTSPLNLIMADSIGNGSESGDKTEEYACRSCGIRFQTQGLYHLHVEKIHESGEQLSPRPEHEADSMDQRTDSISEDLQKLQTMILQLNGLESNKAASCALCGKDYDTPGALRTHMIAEHGVVQENVSSPQQLAREKSSPPISTVQAYCSICEKEYSSQEALRKHIAEDHQPSTPTSSTPQLPSSVTSTPKSNSSQQTERKATASITPTSSYCEICNKELCNKYFMKTHMQKMHGIEIENGAQIGGVICNICKKELCSKYFLRVHKQNTHGIVEEGTTSSKQDNFEPPPAEDVALKPEQLGDLNLRYITHFTEVCPICNRRFRSSKWLKVHLQGEHGKAGIDKWREIEQYHQSMPKTPTRVPSVPKSAQHQQQSHGNTNIRIPNGFEPNQQIRADLAALGNQVLSNFFGSSTEDQQPQTYRCSQLHCNFSTSILPLFFLHERSHNHQQENPSMEAERMIQCPICAQTFAQPEMLRQHIVSRHPNPFPGLLSQFPIPLLNEFAMGNEPQPQHQERNDYSDNKEVLRQPSPQIMNEIDTNKMKKQEENSAVQVMPQGAYKCAQCGFATANLNRIKKHIRKDHKCLGDPAESALAELTKTLKDVANKHKVPASYAMPQDANLTPDKTIMQPFIIEEMDNPQTVGNGCGNDETNPSSRRFAPALVFLPVKTRVSSALTMSFTLNPA